jgi:cytochrome c556
MSRLLPSIVALSLLAVSATAAEPTAEDWGKYRKGVMDAMKGHISALSLVAFGRIEDTGYLQSHADALVDLAGELKFIFPAGSGEGTHALPAVWAEPAKFSAAVAAAEDGTQQLSVAIGSGDRKAIAAAFKATGDACKACHEAYREEHDN